MFRAVFTKSKWIHKYIGLGIILFLMWMSVSGILLNHPDMIANVSVPGWLVPAQYHIKNWNRSSLVSLVYSRQDSQLVFAGGTQGVWRSTDGGKTFKRYEDNFPRSLYYKKTRHLFLQEDIKPYYLLAATDGGLYVNDLNTAVWQSVPLGPEREAVKKILKVKDGLLVFTESNLYYSSLKRLAFQQKTLLREEAGRRVSLVDLFFHLHDGRVWGLPGKLFFDLMGVIIFFLSLSAFYIWYFPQKLRRRWTRKRLKSSQEKTALFRVLFKYHLKLGIWAAAILLVIGTTAFFMRPPFLAVIAEGSIPASWYPGRLAENPWQEKIHNALYDAVEDKIIINASDGNWVARADFSHPFQPYDLEAPLFVMGATVFDAYGTGGYLIGSFNGIYHLERATGHAVDMQSGDIVKRWSNVRPAKYMIAGYFKTPFGEEFITTHQQGLLALGQAARKGRFEMPVELAEDGSMPLWNYMFEIHNGRFFKDLIGEWYILIAPLGALLFVLISLTGIYDWLFLKVLSKKR